MEVYKYHSNITQKRHGASRNYRYVLDVSVVIALVSQPRRVWRLVREIITVEVLTLMALTLLVGSIKGKCIFLDITLPFGRLCVLVCKVTSSKGKNQTVKLPRMS